MHERFARSARNSLIGLALILALAACGGSDDGAETPTDDAAATASDDASTDAADDGSNNGDATDDGADSAGAATEAADPPDATVATDVPAGLADLGSKPEVPDEYLVDVDELTLTDIVVGEGDTAEAGRALAMQYVGVLAADGTEFDASWNRGQPFEFTLGQGNVIQGWDQGIVGMQVGGRRILQIPSEQAYGGTARGSIPADADLVFVVDLISIAPPPPEVPEDALGSFDELNVIDLVEGEGDEVAKGDIVSVQYVGVNAEDGIEFDSSFSRGAEPFRVVAGEPGVIEGWQQGLLGMKVGGERILQIPSDLAYGSGDLVFRVHLEDIMAAPAAHQLSFGGEPPSETEVEVLVEGSGDPAGEGDFVTAEVVVWQYRASAIVSSTYVNGSPAILVPNAPDLLPGLGEGLDGIKLGETRQVVIPATVAFPDGVPPQAGIDEDDAVVFVVEAISIDEAESATE